MEEIIMYQDVLHGTQEVEQKHQAYKQNAETTPDVNEAIRDSFSIFGDVEQFKNYINLSKASVVECIDSFIENHAGYMKTNAYSNLSSHIRRLEAICNVVIKPQVVGDEFMCRFDNYLSDQCSLASSTIASHIGNLKNVLRWARECGATLSPTIDRYKVKSSPARPKVALTQEEYYKLYYFDIDTLPYRECYRETLKKVRDQFLLACFLGQRYSDVKRITEKNFEGTSKEIFKITQQKTENEAVVDFIKMFKNVPSIAKEILERYNYTAPYPHDISAFNKHLHKLCKFAGIDKEYVVEKKVKGVMVQKKYKKYELISSHCARRSFVSNAVKNNLHSEMIKRATGHKSESSFNKYVVFGD